MLTAQQADTILKNINKGEADKWPHGIQTLVIDLYKGNEELRMRVGQLAKVVVRMVKELEIRGGGGGDPSTEVAGDAQVTAASSEVRIGADGQPLTAQEIENEKLMDAAITSAPAAQAARPSGSNRAARRAAARTTAQRVGSDGQPLSPEQAKVEEEADAIFGPRE